MYFAVKCTKIIMGYCSVQVWFTSIDTGVNKLLGKCPFTFYLIYDG